jgi:hypothetical protein
MRDLIKKILKEESEVKEMGVSIGKLRASQPKNYLVKSLIDKEKNDQPKVELKKIVQKCNQLFSQINDELKDIKWNDLKLVEHNKFFYVELPSRVKNKIVKLVSLYNELDENNYLIGLTHVNKIENFYYDYDEFYSNDHIYLYIDEPRNRTHFPEGLPKSLLGYNLGVKIYRNLLNKLGFMQSEENATKAVQEVYRKLMQMPDVNTVIYKNSILLIEDGLPKNKVIDIVSDSIYEYYMNMVNPRKLILNRSIIVNTKLLRIIGETRLLNMMYELFYSAKKQEKTPFENLGYKLK